MYAAGGVIDAAHGRPAGAAAIAFLLRATMRNRFTRQLDRLRQPRYLLALLIGIAYFALVFLPGDHERDAGMPDAAAEVAPLVLALYLAWSWLWGGHRYALAFSPAEVQYLFPAPLTRRTLVHYRLLRGQVGLALSVVLFTFLLADAGLAWPLRLLGLWLLLTTVHMHQIAASLVHASTDRQGARGALHHVVPLAAFVLALAALAWSAALALPSLRAAASADEVMRTFTEALRRPPAAIVLYPLRLVLAPALAADAVAWLRALPGAALLLLLHYVWVVRTDAAFEEAAAEAGTRRARRREAARAGRPAIVSAASGRRRALLFPLRSAARPAEALLWKNLVAFVRGLRRNTLFLLLAVLPLAVSVSLVSMHEPERAANGLATGALVLAALILVLGPLGIRNDLRQDLAHVALLRTYPLRGAAIVAAEVASAAVVLTLAQMALVLIALAAAVWSGGAPAGGTLLPVALAVLIGLPAVNALALTIQNALALFFPAWMRIGTDAVGGVEFMGQHILRLAGALLLMGLALIPPLLVAAAVAFQLLPALGPLAAAPAGGAALAALWVEVAIVVVWLGRAFERLDPVDAGLRA